MDDANVLTLEGCELRLPRRVARVMLGAGVVAVSAAAACMLWWLAPSLFGGGIIAVLLLLAVLAGVSTLWSP